MRPRNHRPRVRRTLRLVAAVLAAVAALLPNAATHAQTPTGVLRLRGQTTWWSAEQPVTLELGVRTSAPADLVVAVDLFGRLKTRTGFAATVDKGVVGRPVNEIPPIPLADLPTDETGDRILTFVPPARAEGVYPIRVQLRTAAGGEALDTFVTYLVHVPSTMESDPLSVALVVPAHAPPAVQPDGRVAIDDARAEQLADLATSLEDHPDVGLTLAATPETVEALATSPRAQDRQTVATLSAALGNRQLLGTPWVPTNLTAVIDGGLEEESAGLLSRGVEALRTHFPGAEPSTSTRLVDERLTDAGIAFLQSQQQATRLVVPEPMLEPIKREKTLVQQFAMESRRGPVQAVGVDAAMAAHFSAKDPVLGAHRLLADLAVIYNDDPEIGRRGVAVRPPRTWVPDADFVDALLDGLASSPILRSVTLDRFFTVVDVAMNGTGSRAVPLVRRPVAAAGPTTDGGPLPSASIRAERRRLDSFASAVDATNPAGAAMLDRLDRTLLASTSADLRARDRSRYVTGAADQLDDEIAGIAMPQDRSITLTAREGEIPVTVSSALGYPVRAILTVASDTLEFPDGDRQDLALPDHRNATLQFSVRAQSSGSFPLAVEVVTPDGRLVLAHSRFTVRSTAISGVGTAVSIGAALFLLVWWANHLRGRRSRRLVPS
ncbi:MAG TPA: DUF6049 family protein [Acidimicrobiales bacterium]|nr:DUF6049 family protein [Acidimicrobiales bacterium]